MKRKVQVWIRSKEKGEPRVLLLLTRPSRGTFWQPVTGSVEKGETLEQGALREATEESGLDFRKMPEPIGHEFNFTGRKGKPIRETCFSIWVDDCPDVTLDPKEHVDSIWVSPVEALKRLRFESNREALLLIHPEVKP